MVVVSLSEERPVDATRDRASSPPAALAMVGPEGLFTGYGAAADVDRDNSAARASAGFR